MKTGYILTDFPLWDEERKEKTLKTSSIIIKNSPYGNVLIDAGSSYHSSYFVNELQRIFQLDPSMINYILLTHSHPDHAGLCNLFTNAVLIADRSDLNLSLKLIEINNEKKSIYDFMIKECGDYKTTFSLNDSLNVEEYLKASWCDIKALNNYNICFIDESPDILNFFKPLETPGHTFTHTGYVFESCGEKILCTGDAISNRMILLTDNSLILEAQMDITKYLDTIENLKSFSGIFACGHDFPFHSDTFKSFRKNIIFEE